MRIKLAKCTLHSFEVQSGLTRTRRDQSSAEMMHSCGGIEDSLVT